MKIRLRLMNCGEQPIALELQRCVGFNLETGRDCWEAYPVIQEKESWVLCSDEQPYRIKQKDDEGKRWSKPSK